jgi:hypothetical protein
MASRTRAWWLFVLLSFSTVAGPRAGLAAVPPGRQHVLTIKGENTVMFAPRAGLTGAKVDFNARIEYIVNTRTGDAAVSSKKSSRKSPASTTKSRRKDGGEPPLKITSAVDIFIHSTEMKFRLNDQTVVDSHLSRSRLQGQINPNSPVLDVSMKNAPPRLQEILKMFDTTAATMLLDEDSRVVSRKFRTDAPFHAIIETVLSIHTPIPRAVAFWEAPTRLVMGHGQTAKGMLRFEKEKESVAKTGGLVRVKVSGVLKAEGVVAGNLIKDGTYTVTGEQLYEPSSREWRSARWSVVVDNELANPAGIVIARAKGNMLVESRLFDDSQATTLEPTIAKP